MQLPGGIQRADVSLTNAAIIIAGTTDNNRIYADNAIPNDNGDTNIYAHNLSLENSQIVAGFGNQQQAPDNQAGDIIIDASGNLEATAGTLIENSVRPEARGNSGDILITVGGNLLLCGNLVICSIVVQTNLLWVDGNVEINASTESASVGGEIEITANRVELQNGEILTASTGSGNSGNIQINALETDVLTAVILRNGSRIVTRC